jgi:N-acetylglucosaminyl-diphospho-decaprenol L-rhamnosyltransferase
VDLQEMTPPGVTTTVMPTVTVSVVSHGHGDQVMQLLCKLHALCLLQVGRVVLTINVPEPTLVAQVKARPWAFDVTVLQNLQPKGFGANHNAAFVHSTLDYFCVVNPDIDFDADPFTDLIRGLADPLAGCSFPVQVDAAGQLQDHARSVPSPVALLERYSPFGVTRQAQPQTSPDWVNGAFMLFRAAVFRHLGGFDERYFMYCEDVDICLRLQLAGYRLSRSDVKVTHAAHRSSRVNVRHLAWHVVSLLRLWTSAPYRHFVRIKQDG